MKPGFLKFKYATWHFYWTLTVRIFCLTAEKTDSAGSCVFLSEAQHFPGAISVYCGRWWWYKRLIRQNSSSTSDVSASPPLFLLLSSFFPTIFYLYKRPQWTLYKNKKKNALVSSFGVFPPALLTPAPEIILTPVLKLTSRILSKRSLLVFHSCGDVWTPPEKTQVGYSFTNTC